MKPPLSHSFPRFLGLFRLDAVLRESIDDVTVTETALRLGMTRAALYRILKGSAGISADMALRLERALAS
ncbi:helix-turn-helix domain-containing protein [Billgrantia pellis]|uniref:Helix-turn-helix domain-containing protein n=1 Tax=Billgrantia pellis TaxID=2606936 RepID=A0A7V7G2Q6_9GAMM|nr:helix-turn-helix domain-containing protein [Halomonas pellis]KAA0014485.1 helix-turn-helix domain-containing protein [Halomonas pellis]